jgi:tripartite-type tricarboxylate transporter receptor subunit TctC
MMKLKHLLNQTLLAVATAAALLGLGAASAQTPLKIITSDQAGGGMDSLIRPMAEQLSKLQGRPVIVDNKAGAQGRIAGQAVANAAPDGNTLLITVQAGVVINPHVYKYPYDALSDLVPVTDLGRGSLLLLVPGTNPANNFKEFTAWVKAQPKDSISYGTYSAGTISHFGGLLLAQGLGVEMTAIHYKASGDAVKELVPGVTQLLWNGAAGPVIQLIKAGRLKAFAYMGPNRLAALPNVPTIRELGLPDVEADGWIGIFAPKGTPAATLDKLNADLAKVLASADIKALYTQFGFEAGGKPAAEFAKLIKTDNERWGAYIKKIGYKAE